mmetsp:Transcript_43344/g.125079  ORF Transcript_43344/g.125079 Transcript_43344/m.125079 type:complete len:222 (+) Transcript_43344:1197-1862(+)
MDSIDLRRIKAGDVDCGDIQIGMVLVLHCRWLFVRSGHVKAGNAVLRNCRRLVVRSGHVEAGGAVQAEVLARLWQPLDHGPTNAAHFRRLLAAHAVHLQELPLAYEGAATVLQCGAPVALVVLVVGQGGAAGEAGLALVAGPDDGQGVPPGLHRAVPRVARRQLAPAQVPAQAPHRRRGRLAPEAAGAPGLDLGRLDQVGPVRSVVVAYARSLDQRPLEAC